VQAPHSALSLVSRLYSGQNQGPPSLGHYNVHDWVEWPERESDHIPLYNVEITSGAIILSPSAIYWHY
jgi:hypothetical protein